MNDSAEPIRERIERQIAAEAETVRGIVAYIEEGRLNARISDEEAAELIGCAERRHDANVKLLRDLLDGGESC